MIRLTRLNGKEFLVNSDMIKLLEETPDTVVTLTNGEILVVNEDVDEIVDRVIDYSKRLRAFPSEV